jgi:hypothetical protein
MFNTFLARLHSEYMAGLAEMMEGAESQAIARRQETAARHSALAQAMAQVMDGRNPNVSVLALDYILYIES